MRLFGLIGYPLSHSFSKKYFAEKFARENIRDCKYELFPIHDIQQITDLIKNHPDLNGLNVTVPYKQLVLSYLSHSNIPAGLKACNCIKIEKDKLIGYNTDLIAFKESLIPLLNKQHTKALILGEGGAAAAVQFGLKKLHIDFNIVSRRTGNSSVFTYSSLTREVISEHTLIINTTPLGTSPDINECPAIDYDGISEKHLLYDLIYNPEKTKFLAEGEKRGAEIYNGYNMLVIQAEESWKIWNEGIN
ncbi:MAG: shikimate dehydrogenase [Chitinophagaceae bacterium]